ncbi:TetR/AcrR family transcriptional regulator [Nocardia sp. CA-120079]|uniref:TetR/AcrR family transcriptional regulator n=1 Tax=Nocardia sp. CA-120079 TaxID=3239974 RepID=UPI003D98EB2E
MPTTPSSSSSDRHRGAAGTEHVESGASGNREQTERIIEAAALQLLADNGVLAGLNLREVADSAKVNRGLVYHYYGTRRELLRSALRHRAKSTPTWGMDASRAEQPFVERTLNDLAKIASLQDQNTLITLLHLDGDPDIRILPGKRLVIAVLQQDQRDGDLRSDLDVEALHAMLSALFTGYSLYRTRFAQEMGRTVEELDDAAREILMRFLDGVTQSK